MRVFFIFFFTHHSSCKGILSSLSRTVCLPSADAYSTPAWLECPTEKHHIHSLLVGWITESSSVWVFFCCCCCCITDLLCVDDWPQLISESHQLPLLLLLTLFHLQTHKMLTSVLLCKCAGTSGTNDSLSFVLF